MKDMSLAPWDQQAEQEIEVSIMLAEGVKKSCSLLPAAPGDKEKIIGQRRDAGQWTAIELWSTGRDSPLGRLPQGTDSFLQLMAEANTGSMTYTPMDLGCSASQQEENTHCWQSDS